MLLIVGIAGLLSIVHGDAIIGNDQVVIGVNNDGDLNVAYVGGFLSLPASDPLNINYLGLRSGDGQYSSTEAGCLCEGWGVGVPNLGISAYQDRSVGDSGTISESFVGSNGGTSAVSTVRDSTSNFRVVHDYHTTTKTAYAIECTVTITNIGDSTFDTVLYRRVMDWDITPTEFSEYVTLQGWPADNLYRTHDNGFESPNPLDESQGPLYATLNANFVDSGPNDHGASLTFSFDGPFDKDDVVQFDIYYGTAEGETAALSALSAVGAEVYSLGQQDASPVGGLPYTFFFGFTGVGGEAICPEFQYVDGLPAMTQAEAQTYCEDTYNSDLASFTSEAEVTCVCDLIGDGSSPWVQLEGDHDVGFSFPDGTACPREGAYCVEDDLWCDSAPLGCKEGSTCVRVIEASDATCACTLKNDKDCDDTLTAVLCNPPVVV